MISLRQIESPGAPICFTVNKVISIALLFSIA